MSHCESTSDFVIEIPASPPRRSYMSAARCDGGVMSLAKREDDEYDDEDEEFEGEEDFDDEGFDDADFDDDDYDDELDLDDDEDDDV